MKVRALPIAERMRLYNEAWKLRKEFGYGSHRIAKILNIGKDTVDAWIYGNSSPAFVRIKFSPKPCKELAYAIGVILGDASVWLDNNKWCRIELKSKDKDFVENFSFCMTKLFNKNQMNSIKHTYDGYCRVIYGSKEFYNFRQALTLDKLKVLIKSYEVEFLRGLFDSEGSVHVQASKQFDIGIGLSNTDEELLKFVSDILKTDFKINSSLVKVKEKGSMIKSKVNKYFRNKDVWRLQIHSLYAIKIFLNVIGFSIKRKQEKLKDAIEINHKFSDAESCIFWRNNYKLIGREWVKV